MTTTSHSEQPSVPTIDRFSPAYRSTHLGASQWPAAAGLDPYSQPIDLYSRFIGLTPWDDYDVEPEAIELGHALEDGVARLAARRLGLDARTSPTLEHPRHTWLCATPDRVLSDGSLLQVKTTRLTRPSFEVIEEWGEPGTDEVPPRVLAQVTAELVVYRAAVDRTAQTVHVAALIGGRGACLYRVDFDADLAGMLFERVEAFWRSVQEKRPPQPDASDAFANYLAARYPSAEKGRLLEADAQMEEYAKAYREARQQRERFEEQEKVNRAVLQQLIGGAEGIKGSFGKITWGNVQGRESIDMDGLRMSLDAMMGREKAAEFIKQHTKRGAGHRAFRPTWTKESK